MNRADVLVTVEGGVADVDVRTSNVTVEIRDYDVDGVEEDHELLWTDENGDCCIRRFAVPDDTASLPLEPDGLILAAYWLIPVELRLLCRSPNRNRAELSRDEVDCASANGAAGHE